MRKEEHGFILVTTLVLLSILTLLGITSTYKTLVEIKVSKMAVDMDRALMVANTGLTQLYWTWSKDAAGMAELAALSAYIGSAAGALPNIYLGSITPESMDDPLISDSIIQNSTGMHIYTFTDTGISNAISWGNTTQPQVAVWVTTFDDIYTAPEYPYTQSIDLSSGGICIGGCRIVTYALGRSGKARRLIRETHSVLDHQLMGVSAMTNAPIGDNFSQLCNPTSNNTGNATSGNTIWPTNNPGNGSAIIEITQAPYSLGSVPSGIAIASNTGIASGKKKGFRKAEKSQTGTSFASEPYLIYAGHGTKSAFKVDWSSTSIDTTAADLPSALLPTKLVNGPMMLQDDKVDYFSNPSAQLFNIDAYRWGAEQFTCQNAPYTAARDGQYGNGIYCSKAEALRAALVSKGYPAYAPVTGRLTITQFQYNLAKAIPMFGLVRVLFPAVPDTGVNVQTCSSGPTRLHVIESGGDSPIGNYDFNSLMACDSDCSFSGGIPDPAGGQYAFTIANGAVPDNDGDLGANARMMVYGTLLIDYFADYDIQGTSSATASADISLGSTTDAIFNPADGERLLLPLESPDVYLAIEHNIMINPVMPRFMGTIPQAFPTAAPQAKPAGSNNNLSSTASINMVDVQGPSTNTVHLASPYDGYFPWSEGMLPVIGASAAGTMRLMSRSSPADNPNGLGLIQMVTDLGVNSEINTVDPGASTAMSDLLNLTKPSTLYAGTEANVLHYYYDMMVENLSQNNALHWPVSPWPGDNFSNNFCIGSADCGNATPNTWNNNMGDKFHLFFPSGYVHGWKVALAALNIKATEWNSLLSGVNTTAGISDATGAYAQMSNACSADGLSTGSGCPMGLPYHFGIDAGAISQSFIADLQSHEADYFNVTADVATGYGLIDADWRDIPSTMYSGGLLDMHAHSNMSGIMYTPGPLEWEPGNSNYDGGIHMSYVNGAIITGYGSFTKNKVADDRYVLVYDSQSLDNMNVNSATISLRRYDWQMLP